MQYFSVILAVMAGSAFVSAAPSQGDISARASCRSGYQVCGTCSSGSCSIDQLGTRACEDGSCSSDGSFCGVKSSAVQVTCT